MLKLFKYIPCTYILCGNFSCKINIFSITSLLTGNFEALISSITIPWASRCHLPLSWPGKLWCPGSSLEENAAPSHSSNSCHLHKRQTIKTRKKLCYSLYSVDEFQDKMNFSTSSINLDPKAANRNLHFCDKGATKSLIAKNPTFSLPYWARV